MFQRCFSCCLFDNTRLLVVFYRKGVTEMGRQKAIYKSGRGTTEAELDMQDVLDSVQDELVVIDSEYRVRQANLAALGRLKNNVKSPIGKLCYEVFYGRERPCEAPLWDCPLKQVIKSGKMKTILHPVGTLGTETYLKIIAYPFRDDKGSVKAIVELRRDVTAESELEDQMLRRQNQLMALNQISGAVSGMQDLDAILNIALDNVLKIINGSIGGILLMDMEPDVLYYRTQRGFSSKKIEEVRIRVGDGIAGGVAKTGEPMLLEDISKDSRTVYLDIIDAENLKGFVSIPLKSKDKVVGVMNIASREPGQFGAEDLSLLSSIGHYLGTAIEQASLYARLSRIGERYRALLKHALTAQEDERKRIAGELHDETSQALTSLTLSLQAAIQMAGMKGIGDTEFIERLKKAHSYAVYAGNEIVKLMKELRPTLLDELGMPAAIHRYAMDTLESKGISVAMEYRGTDDRLPMEVEVTLFRCAQGIIGNILEHSEAKNATIKLDCDSSKCELIIEDDGKGFDVNKLTGVEPSGRGAGLFTIRERLRVLGGAGYVESEPGKGTKVIANVPFSRDVPDEENNSTDS
jgi:signal transduction histidine kinase